jgi:DNA polymerase-3 subunit chi
MTRIEFHFNATDRLPYVCRLLRKAHRQSLRMGVLGSEVVLRQLSAALWTFSDTDFLPHSTPSDSKAIQDASPIQLHLDPSRCRGLDVWVNLGDEVPQGFAQCHRLIEVVASDDHGRMTARQRWRHYTAQGYDLLQHDLSKAAST